MLYSSTLVATLIKRRPHTSFCAPCHEVNGHDVYLAMNRKPGYDFSQMKPFLNSKLPILHFPKFGRKTPPTSTFYSILTLFEPYVLSKHHNESNLIGITLFRDPLRLHNVNLRYFGRHFEKRPLARVPHTSQRLTPSHLTQRPQIYKKTPSILLAPESRTGPQFWTLLFQGYR